MAKQDDYIRLTIRLPKDLHEALVTRTANAPHSLNVEIVKRLAQSLLSELPTKETADMLEEYNESQRKHPSVRDPEIAAILEQMSRNIAENRALREVLLKLVEKD